MCLLKPILSFNFKLIIREANILSIDSKRILLFEYIFVKNLYKFAIQ